MSTLRPPPAFANIFSDSEANKADVYNWIKKVIKSSDKRHVEICIKLALIYQKRFSVKSGFGSYWDVNTVYLVEEARRVLDKKPIKEVTHEEITHTIPTSFWSRLRRNWCG